MNCAAEASVCLLCITALECMIGAALTAISTVIPFKVSSSLAVCTPCQRRIQISANFAIPGKALRNLSTNEVPA